MTLKKLSAVLAVTLPLAASAQQAAAPAPLYQIYGTLNLNYMVVAAPSASNRTLSIRPRESVSVDSTNLGIRGTVDTGQFGLGVVYQCESSANLDGVGAAGICARNSRLGLTTAFGTIFYGNWDTPYKAVAYGTKADDAFGNTDVYDEGSVIGSPGFNARSGAGQTNAAPAAFNAGTAGNAAVVFNVRAANSVAYHSPKFMGIGVKAQYSVSEFADAKYRRAPELYSAAVNFDQGPISVFAAWEDHEDWLSQTSRDYGIKVGAGYELGTPFGTTTIGVKGEQLWYEDKSASAITVGGAAVKKYDRQAAAIDVKHRTGSHELRARFIYADAGTAHNLAGTKLATGGFGAKNWALGYAYYLTSAAQVYAYYTQIENERNAQYTFSTGGPAFVSANPGVPAGSDPWAVGLGLRYAF